MCLTTKTRPYYECSIFIGCINELTKKKFNQKKIERSIAKAQKLYMRIIPVRITPTTFISGTTYKEKGWEISAINYPRINAEDSEINSFMNFLAKTLLLEFGQKRISVINPEEITMYENSSLTSG